MRRIGSYPCISSFPLLLAFVGVILGGVSCSPTIIQVCSVGWSQFEREMIAANAQLKPWATGRQLASSRAPSREAPPFTAEEKEKWQAWAKTQIKRTQQTMDIFEESLLPEAGKLKRALSEITDDLVEFDGYVGKEDPARMAEVLARAYGRGNQLRREICAATK